MPPSLARQAAGLGRAGQPAVWISLRKFPGSAPSNRQQRAGLALILVPSGRAVGCIAAVVLHVLPAPIPMSTRRMRQGRTLSLPFGRKIEPVEAPRHHPWNGNSRVCKAADPLAGVAATCRFVVMRADGRFLVVLNSKARAQRSQPRCPRPSAPSAVLHCRTPLRGSLAAQASICRICRYVAANG